MTGYPGDGNVTVIDGATNATSTVPAGNVPIGVAVNPATDKIYVANYYGSNVTVTDGRTNTTSTVPTGGGPWAVAVNPITNRVYVANQDGNNVTVIDGATNATTAVAAGTEPRDVAVNQATNKIYVANQASSNVTVIDGATNATSTVVAGNYPVAVAVNPATSRTYVTNYQSENVTVIEDQGVQASPPATAIMLLAENRAMGAESLFTFEATSATGVPVRDVYYQLGTLTGPWQRAIPTGMPGRWEGQVTHRLPGTPILYAFAVDGREATSVNTGSGSSPIIGNITAYLFQVKPGTTSLAINGHTPNPSYIGQPVEVSFALSVNPPARGTPTGTVTITDGMASCTATLPATRCSLSLSNAGSHKLVASYSGDSSFLPSTSLSVPHSVQPGPTAITIAAHVPEPSFERRPVLVSVALTVTPPASGAPTGVVTVSSGSANCAVALPTSSCSLILAPAGIRTLIASYSGDGNFLSSTSDGVDHRVIENHPVYLPLLRR